MDVLFEKLGIYMYYSMISTSNHKAFRYAITVIPRLPATSNAAIGWTATLVAGCLG